MIMQRKGILQLIKAEIDLERLTDLLADDYIQQAAQELKGSVEEAERG